MASRTCLMPATHVQNLSSSLRVTLCAFLSMTTIVKNSYPGWTKPMSLSVRFYKYLGCLCLGFISPRARNLLSKTDLGSGMLGADRKNEQLALRMYPEELNCFAELLLQIRCTFILACQCDIWLSFVTHVCFCHLFRQSQGFQLQSHCPLFSWHLQVCHYCHCLHHENNGLVIR